MITRRELVQIGAAAAATVAGGQLGPLGRALAQQRLNEAELLQFDPLGNITLLHFADLHGQLMPVHLREPSPRFGATDARDRPPQSTGKDLLRRYGIRADSPAAHALTSEDFEALAKTYGRIGGLDRLATAIKAVRAERSEDRVLLFDGGDSWQGSLGSYRTKGPDMAACIKLLKPDAMTGHWEFSHGEARVKELTAGLGFPFLALNIRDNEWQEPVFDAFRFFEKGGIRVAVLGQAFPYTHQGLPARLVPNWSFGIREDDVQATVNRVRQDRADLVVLLSHDGLDIDLKLASRLKGIDVILTAHTHDPLPQPIKVGRTLLVAVGSHGKFLGRLDLDVRSGEIKDFRFRLIPLFADAIRADPEMTAAIDRVRAPFAAELSRVIGHTDSLLYRRGAFEATFDDLICAALIEERDAEIALSPGFWWGTSLLAGEPIRVEDIHNVTSITFPQVCRAAVTGERLKEILENAADNLLNPDPYYRQGGDMIRTAGLAYTIDPGKPAGQRISNMLAPKTGQPIDPSKEYVVANWACGNEGAEDPSIWDLLERYIARKKTVKVDPGTYVKIVGT
jgi:S-sulfosulfanyl-L-cysteine sulfohydrolase